MLVSAVRPPLAFFCYACIGAFAKYRPPEGEGVLGGVCLEVKMKAAILVFEPIVKSGSFPLVSFRLVFLFLCSRVSINVCVSMGGASGKGRMFPFIVRGVSSAFSFLRFLIFLYTRFAFGTFAANARASGFASLTAMICGGGMSMERGKAFSSKLASF